MDFLLYFFHIYWNIAMLQYHFQKYVVFKFFLPNVCNIFIKLDAIRKLFKYLLNYYLVLLFLMFIYTCYF